MKPFYSHFLLPALIIVPLVFGGTVLIMRLLAEKPEVAYEQPGANVLSYHLRLAEAPVYDSADYFGAGAPYVLVTLISEDGRLVDSLIEVDATPKNFTGYDACGTDLKFRDFRIIAPLSGASNASTNVTYTSETYGSAFDVVPGGDRCSLRAGVESEWVVALRVELDGRKDDVTTTRGDFEIDDWDIQTTYILRGRAVE